MTRLPMFPLESVLVPGGIVSLHVFEPRYRALVRTCIDGDGAFGVVLIERGSEVGGGDRRAGVGTLARILEVQPFPDGRFAVVAAGSERIRIDRWLEDDPHPWAEVSDWPDPDEGDDLTVRLLEVGEGLATVQELMSRLGGPGFPPTIEVGLESASAASHRLVALSPVGPHDRQALLVAASVGARLDLLAELLAQEEAVCRARLGLA